MNRSTSTCLVLAGLLLSGLATQMTSPAAGQDKSKGARKVPKAGRSKPVANTRSLDQRAESLTSSFVKDAETLADDYLEAGHTDKALAVLQKVLTLNPNEASIKQKIDQITDQTMSANEFSVDVNAASGWEPSGVAVAEGRPIRLTVEGTYKFDVGGTLGPAGLVEKDPNKDLITGIPTGALMGIVLMANGKPGKPFLVGAGGDVAPKETGRLLLKINAPAGHRCTGKLKVTLSGNVAAG